METASRKSSKKDSSRRNSKEGGSRKGSKEEGSRRISQEEVVSIKTKDVESPTAPGPRFSFLSTATPLEKQRRSLLKGESTESLDRREEKRLRGQSPAPAPEERRVRRQSPSPMPKQKPVKEVKKGAVAGSKSTATPEPARRVVRPSSTAPVRASTLPRSSKAATTSVTAPILRRPLSQANSSPSTARKAVIETDAKNKTTIKITKSLAATKKVSFEYRAGQKVQVQEGLALADYDNIPAPILKKGGLLGVQRSGGLGGSDLSLNRRGRDEGHRGSTGSLARRPGGQEVAGAGGRRQQELASTWAQLKVDIETAMGRKEKNHGQYKDLESMLQVLDYLFVYYKV